MKYTFLIFSCLTFAAFGQSYQDTCLDSLEIPSTYTPNSEVDNEGLSIHFPCPPEEFEYTIYNRWGSLIYKTEDFQFSWTGTKEDGGTAQADTYFWVLKYTFNGSEASKTGSLTVLE